MSGLYVGAEAPTSPKEKSKSRRNPRTGLKTGRYKTTENPRAQTGVSVPQELRETQERSASDRGPYKPKRNPRQTQKGFLASRTPLGMTEFLLSFGTRERGF